jgi:pSer/pThr/pTyr-binding forkhead associated (FHA) protein/putative methionine-R-sulfoxide reductase with GAF domain
MRLIVKRQDRIINELRFAKGPIYIGRQIGSQVFLPDRSVSRQHTVIYTTTDGKWVAEDLDSANKTYLNNEVIQKAEIKDADLLRIADFQIEIHIEEVEKSGIPVISLEDTLHATLHEAQVVVRHLESSDAALIKMQAKRGKDFAYAANEICKCSDAHELANVLVDLLFHQFKPFHAWVGLRQDTQGAVEFEKGKSINGVSVKLEELVFSLKAKEALRNHQYILIPRLPLRTESDSKVNSAIIAPIMNGKECYGVLYADNSLDHERYGVSDLDYMIFVSLMAGALLKNI